MRCLVAKPCFIQVPLPNFLEIYGNAGAVGGKTIMCDSLASLDILFGGLNI